MKNGGPAFPRKRSQHRKKHGADYDTFIEDPPQDGMTLHQWFAGQALAGLCAADYPHQIARDMQIPDKKGVRKELAFQCLEIANAMLAGYERRGEEE